LTPLSVTVTPVQGALEVQLILEDALPESLSDALPSGAVVRVVYPIRVRKQRTLIWDGRIWKGEAVSRVAFDPLTGRYLCELLLDEVMIDSREVDSAAEARSWLRSPPPFRLVFDELRDLGRLYVRARAIYSTSTTLLVFPKSEGTPWVAVELGASDVGERPGEAPAPQPAEPD
jgi:hypothetical protein